MIERYRWFTRHKAKIYTAITEDGPVARLEGEWVTYEDHAKEIADQRALCREAVKEAYAEAFDDAWNLARGLDADEGLIQECWLKSGAACDFKREGQDDD
jgi:hypothetical protein